MTDFETGKDWDASEPRERFPLADVEAFQQALIDLCQRAKREVSIFSNHLERSLFHEEAVVEALSAFARRSRYARIRILIRDSDPISQRHHRLLPLIQRLTSRIELKKLQPTVDTPDTEFVVGDGCISLLKEDRDQWLGVYCPADRVRAQKLLALFEQDWPLAVQEPGLRRLLV
ncbi:hypothetical protein [Microbulbifer guangxiensis]|uniref:DUF7931 domain-containing protein n=1 Tax=Microbulbifer guangxiensis TaxID=2904249 RepID=UPI001F29D437|nr:hypothetical protein [Microbulbifer guangxiensis]